MIFLHRGAEPSVIMSARHAHIATTAHLPGDPGWPVEPDSIDEIHAVGLFLDCPAPQQVRVVLAEAYRVLRPHHGFLTVSGDDWTDPYELSPYFVELPGGRFEVLSHRSYGGFNYLRARRL